MKPIVNKIGWETGNKSEQEMSFFFYLGFTSEM